MLQSISWPQYLTAMLLLSAAWYAFVLLRYYRPELAGRFKPKTGPEPLVSSSPVIGAIRNEQKTVGAEDLIFNSGDPDDISDSTLAPGPVDELVAEAQTLAEAFKEAPNKTAFLSLLGLLLSRYEPYRDEIDLKTLRPLAAQLPFPIEEHEWPTFKNN